MADPAATGTGVNDKGTGAPSGTESKVAPVVDQEIELSRPDGTKVKIKTSDVLDDKGVPFRNRLSEAERIIQEKDEALSRVQPPAGGGAQPKDKVEEVINEEDLNRMFMTGEGTKALTHILNKIDLNKTVSGILTERDTKTVTAQKFPDLANPKSVFFQRTARIMHENNLYGNPRGISLAAAQAAEELTGEGITFQRATVPTRPTSGSGGVAGDGGGRGGAGGPPELDAAGQALCAKLGVDPAKVAARLESRLSSRNNPGGK